MGVAPRSSLENVLSAELAACVAWEAPRDPDGCRRPCTAAGAENVMALISWIRPALTRAGMAFDLQLRRFHLD